MNAKLNSIDDYESYLGESIEGWSPEQRLAFAAALAERWLPTYEAFSAAEQWGDAHSLRRCLDALWSHVGGRQLQSADQARYSQQLHDSTPHMDDFDAPETLAACMVLRSTLECCATTDSTASAVQAALSGFEAAVPDWAFDPEEQPRLWKKVAARKELKQQLKLIELIGGITRFDEATIQNLRQGLSSPEAVGKVSPKPKKTSPGLTNQTAFEQYRRMIESDLRGKSPPNLDTNAITFAVMLFAEWLGRYSRRLDTITGNFGKLADVAAQQALAVRQRARDAAESDLPDWDPDLRNMIATSMQPLCSAKRVEASSLEQLHAYGPSLRYLWAQAKRLGKSDQEGWNHIVAWARHRPAAWEAEDRRKKQGLALATPALGEHLARKLTWTATGDPEHPWAVEVDGKQWRVRLNDFPDDYMYTLLIGAEAVGDFHDWPETWRR